MEQELAEHCRDLDRRFYGITRKQMMMITFDNAVANGVSGRFNSEKKMAVKDWLKGFYHRQNLSLCTPEQFSFLNTLKKIFVDFRHPGRMRFVL
jgi:hypothetical protein